jgi:low temperature requirement protein LtrA
VSVQTVSLLRDRSRDDSGRVAMVELFFDLVFVFAVTQLSHHLLEHLNPAGVVQTLLMFLALWWLWIFTTWTTNWLDPERVPVRLMLFALMLGGLMLSSSIPQAFAERGLAFAVAFAAMQLFRTAFMVFAFARHGRPDQTRNYARILVWLLASTVLWVLGGLAEPTARLGWWTAAVALEYAGPIAYFRVPGLGRSRTESWDVEGRHIAERCALFVIIALGESLLITGATFADARWTAVTLAAFATALLGSIAMWWIYFDTGADARAAGSRVPEIRAASRAWRTPICICRSRPGSSSPQWPTNSCSRTRCMRRTPALPRFWVDRRYTCSAPQVSNGPPICAGSRRCRTWPACCCCARWRRSPSHTCCPHSRWVRSRPRS